MKGKYMEELTFVSEQTEVLTKNGEILHIISLTLAIIGVMLIATGLIFAINGVKAGMLFTTIGIGIVMLGFFVNAIIDSPVTSKYFYEQKPVEQIVTESDTF